MRQLMMFPALLVMLALFVGCGLIHTHSTEPVKPQEIVIKVEQGTNEPETEEDT